MILLKTEMVYKGNQRSKKFKIASFRQDQKRETRRNPKILATSQMDKMAPKNVTTSGTLKLDARREAHAASAILSVKEKLSSLLLAKVKSEKREEIRKY